jgi:Mrp family chromosome partitioning ATPase
MESDRALSESIYHLAEAGIWLLPAGTTSGDPLETIQSAKLPALLQQMTAWFDWIIIDCPPVLPLADTSAWARLADGILLVARRDVTEKKKLQRGLEALEPSKLIGALLNASDGAFERDYYYYHRSSKDSGQSDGSAD